MAYDEGLAEILRSDLDGQGRIDERKMFGGLCFMLNDNMLCGVHKGGGMFRVGKANYAKALRIEGVQEMAFTGRPMGGMVDVSDEALVDDTRRAQLMAIARDFVDALPRK